MENWREELAELLKTHELSMKAVSIRSGRGETFVRDMLKRDREPSAANFEAVQKAVNEMIAESGGAPDKYSSTRVHSIPDLHIFGGMGNGGEFEIEVFDNGAPTDSDQVRGYWTFPGYMVRALGNLQHIYAWEVRGDSMEPTLPGGSVVFVDTSQSHIPPDDIYAIDHGDGLMVKRVKLVPRTDQISVISDNEHYGADDLARSEVRIYGRVVGWFQWRG